MADTAFSTPEQFYAAGGAKDWSNVQTLTPGQTATGQFYKYNAPTNGYNVATVFQNSAWSPPNTSNPVSTNQITNGSAVNLPQGSTPDNGSSLVAGSIASNPPTVAGSNTPTLDMATTGDYTQDSGYQAANTVLQGSEAEYKAETETLPSQADLLTKQQGATGATADLTALNQLKTQLASETAAYQNASAAAETKGIKEGTPAVFYQGEQAAIQRQQAVRIGALSAQMQAAQGNYDTAEALAEKTASLQFSDAQNKINNTLQFIQLNQNNLSQAEKVAVSKMQAQATQDQAKLDAQKNAVAFAITNNIQQPFYNIGGTVYRTSDGKAYSTPAQFFADGGAQDFSDVQTVDSSVTATKDAVVQLANKYPDAKISLSDTLGQAQDKVTSNSALYKNSIRMLSSPGRDGVNAPQGTSSPPVVDQATDSAVAQIIANNPKEWGHAADAIDAQFGAGTATKYDAWLKAVYQDGQSIDNVYQPQSGLTPYMTSKLAYASNIIVSNYVKSPIYQAVANGSIYLARINAANQTPGSVSDNDLLDSLVKLNTAGNQVTDAQVKTITGGQSFADTINVFTNKFKQGGVLSDSQRQQLTQLANAVYQNYQKAYTPIYNQAASQLRGANIPPAYWTIPDWNKLTGQVTGNVSAEQLATQQGYDYNAMKAQGYSDQEIINALQ